MTFNYQPGQIVKVDFRQRNPKDFTNNSSGKDLKLLQWNIERGYKLSQIIETLKMENADIISLQEIDINCERTDYKNVFIEIAKALEVQAVFCCEFIELEHPCRSFANRVGNRGTGEGQGYHGNAIFSKYDILSFDSIWHRFQPFDWEKECMSVGEPRKGGRYSLVSTISIGDSKLRVYNLHLEVFCGVVGRLAQFSEVMEDCQKNISEYPHQVILGDLNTMAHGIARLSPRYCRDALRWCNMGKTEGELWDDMVFSVTNEDGPTNIVLETYFYQHVLPFMKPVPVFARPKEDARDTVTSSTPLPLSPLNPNVSSKSFFISTDKPILYQYELDKFFVNIRNCDFIDPFSITDYTLHNYYGIYAGKLDWTLMRHMSASQYYMGNLAYTGSDHRYLAVTADFDVEGIYAKSILNEKRKKRIQSLIKQQETKPWLSKHVGMLAGASLIIAAYGLYRLRNA